MGAFTGGWLLALAAGAVVGLWYGINRQAWRDRADVKAKLAKAKANSWATLGKFLRVSAVVVLLTVALVFGLVMRARGR